MLCFDPKYKYDFLLDDGDTLTFHFPTASEVVAMEKEFLLADSGNGLLDELPHLINAVKIVLSDWSITDRSGQKIPFDLTKIADAVSFSDLWDIRYRLSRELVIGEQLKKNSLRASLQNTGKSSVVPPIADAVKPTP